MIRGTTPTEVFTVNNPEAIDLAQCSQIWATITDNSGKDYTWDSERLVVDGNTISLELTQEETLRFKVGAARAQLRFLYSDGTAFASRPCPLRIEDVRKDGVIS